MTEELIRTGRSRRPYIYWSIALALLISTALLCWLFVGGCRDGQPDKATQSKDAVAQQRGPLQSSLSVEIETGQKDYRSWNDVEIRLTIINNSDKDVDLYLGNGARPEDIQYVAFSLRLESKTRVTAKRHFFIHGWRKAHPVTTTVRKRGRSRPITLEMRKSRGDPLFAGEYTCQAAFRAIGCGPSAPVWSNKVVFSVQGDLKQVL